MESEYQYIIRQTGSRYEAYNTSRDQVDSLSTTNAATPINFALRSLVSSGGTSGLIFIKKGVFKILSPINIIEDDGQGLGIKGSGSKATILDFQPTSTLSNGIVMKMTHGRLEGMQLKLNSNVINGIKLDGTGHDGTGGQMSDILIHGPHADDTGAFVAGQVGISQQNTPASYWWKFHDIKCRALSIGFTSTAAGGGSTSSMWTSSVFQNCDVGMDIWGTQHQGSNIYFQGTAAVGVYGLRLRGTAAGCLFTNLQAELFKTATNTACVELDAGAHHNAVSNYSNAQGNGTTWLTLSDNSGNATNVLTAGKVNVP
jgi:hypothetical protein